jgi:hypothetical protein
MILLRKEARIQMEGNQIAWLRGAERERRSLAAEVVAMRRRLAVTRWMLATALLLLAALILAALG